MAIAIADTAQVDPRAELADDVEIGPYCVVGPDVALGRGTRLIGHAWVVGHTRLGEQNVVHPFAVIGGEPQDKSYRGGPTRVEIGNHNSIREHVTINRATEKEHGVTRIGHHNLIMAGTHIAHDCILADHINLANNVLLGGHVQIDAHASLFGAVAVHHYVTIGSHSFVGGHSRIFHDVPCYMLVDGSPAKVRCINIVGLKRAGVDPQAIDALHEAHRLIFRAKLTPRRAAEVLQGHGHWSPEVELLFSFLQAQQEGKHGRARERHRASPPSLLEAEGHIGS
jgi:UDP-N-acetylglucosamine acyltransferase